MDRSLAGPVAWLSLARLANLVLGALLIPLLIHFLGADGFAAWAVLLAASAVFAQLDLGMPYALFKHVAVSVARREALETSRLASTAIVFGAGVYCGAAPIILLAARPLADWLKLPPGRLLTSPEMIALVYVSVALRSVLQHGNSALYAAREFRLVAVLSFLQAFLSNLGATLGAGLGRSVDATLLAFWAPQLLVMASAFILAGRRLSWRIRPALATWRGWRELASYGLKVQAYEWSQTFAFQVTKFIVLRSVGLWGVARFEAAARAALALRSIPAAGTDAFVPSASVGLVEGERPEDQLRRMTLLAGHGALLFIAAPVAIGPVLLYAWVGEMGYVSRWAFAALGLAAAASLLCLPAAAVAQAAGRPGLQARAGIVSLSLTLPIAIGLARVWGVEGAALGASLAVCAGGSSLLWQLSALGGVPVAASLRHAVDRLWPMVAACLGWGACVHLAFGAWLDAAPIAARYSIPYRAAGGLTAVFAYVVCVLLMFGARGVRGSVEEDERDLLLRVRMLLGAWRA